MYERIRITRLPNAYLTLEPNWHLPNVKYGQIHGIVSQRKLESGLPAGNLDSGTIY